MDAKMPSLSSAAPAAATTNDSASRPKPCCVCKDEKAKRDECMLFSNAKDPQADCQSFVQQYKSCMLGFGYKV
ncbi:cytochrome c oxidase copper chaperone protein [Cordyceps militaris CM01]|uniref:Cytochrome c oxidase copper chaperone protein n=2 Tax=Cordyceps militaris TaxID=73501 RepID=G3JJF8_CORMM|nr:cytochrome c oxidase copper chaperone protein [Cordyceps militaris CM01]ATY59460.1 cytochrome c oxidase copper chaperone [Cordyceps militaris]EGX92046.1 cytochrome c oxidase copper chaperone protein [Cordyceps militaris CM01]